MPDANFQKLVDLLQEAVETLPLAWGESLPPADRRRCHQLKTDLTRVQRKAEVLRDKFR